MADQDSTTPAPAGSLDPNVGCRTYHNIDDIALQSVRWAVEAGIEYAQMCLQDHDIKLGRTTRKNQFWAEHMETDIKGMQATLLYLPAANVKIRGAPNGRPCAGCRDAKSKATAWPSGQPSKS